jgi:hypothetical protein
LLIKKHFVLIRKENNREWEFLLCLDVEILTKFHC